MPNDFGKWAVGIVTAATLLRVAGPTSSPHESSAAHPTTAPEKASKKSTGAGPWIASCEYWAPARLATEPDIEEQPDISTATGETKSECGDDLQKRWGLPDSNPTPEIASLIAVVPDPVRTNMALQFDRTIDTLMVAAGEYGYLSSYYWLPWKEPSAGVKASDEENGDSRAEAAKNGHEPGLIVFKYVPQSTQSFARVLYLFLVAETPTTGIDGSQMQKAFQYQDDLEKAGTTFSRSTKNDPSNLSIIGPMFSGSAASLRQAIETMLAKHPAIKSVSVNGATSTRLAVNQLDSSNDPASLKIRNCDPAILKIRYCSFSYDGAFIQDHLLGMLGSSSSDTDPTRVAFLVEEGTAFGKNFGKKAAELGTEPKQEPKPKQIIVGFPRGISMLRNAQAEHNGAEGQNQTGSAPTPYLHLSLKDSNAYDSVPHLSRENTPLSQEAQLMTIARQLQRYRSEYIVISGSNVLDQLFLAQFLHRACPDARLVFNQGDLLFEREIDNVPFIGTITLTPYPLISVSSPLGGAVRRAYSDSNTEAYYNAASYTIWSGPPNSPALAGYRNFLDPEGELYPPLWVTAIGSDGYYPLGIAWPQASNSSQILPHLSPPTPSEKAAPQRQKIPVSPGLFWRVLCISAFLLCIVHSVLLWIADYWSPFTRELDVRHNVDPYRRAMYIHIGTAMLFCMTFVVALPLFPTFGLCERYPLDVLLSRSVLVAGIGTLLTTFWKTWKHIGWQIDPTSSDSPTIRFCLSLQRNVSFIFNMIAWLTLLAVPLLWRYLCYEDERGGVLSQIGLFFSFRCVHPGSGVSPIIPVLLLLFSWYLWAIFQIWRLRFSDESRPMLPKREGPRTSYPLFVAEDELGCDHARGACLYKNITCLLITREIFRRILRAALGNNSEKEKKYGVALDLILVPLYLIALTLFVRFVPVTSLDEIFWASKGFPTPYEILITALFFPLLVISLTSWLRMILIWGALRRGLLEGLENMPIRFAFSRLKATGRITIMRQGSWHEQWRDIARSTESVRQIINEMESENPSRVDHPYALGKFTTKNDELDSLIKNFLDLRDGVPPEADEKPKADEELKAGEKPKVGDEPKPDKVPFVLMQEIQKKYSEFSKELLTDVLIPHWEKSRGKSVAGEEGEAGTEGSSCVRMAEEFLAIRYLSLIRAVLVNLRYLMVFVSVSFVLAIVAWNSYPFQPRQFINWVFTGMLAVLGCGIISVLAQMHRDPVLSRITHTKANELGIEFYIRIVAFGAVPVLTWLAYQFPEFGSTIFKFIQPGLEVVK